MTVKSKWHEYGCYKKLANQNYRHANVLNLSLTYKICSILSIVKWCLHLWYFYLEIILCLLVSVSCRFGTLLVKKDIVLSQVRTTGVLLVPYLFMI